MAIEVNIPKLGMSMTEATLTEWKVNEGDEVKEGDAVLIITTEKTTWEVEALGSGFIHIIARVNDVQPVGAVVGLIAATQEELVALQKDSPVPSETASTGSATDPKASGGSAKAKDRKVKASPVARKIAKDNNVDISTVTGTGTGGRISKEDVKKAIREMKSGHSPVAAPLDDPDTEVRDGKKVKKTFPVRGMRKAIADHMSHSLQVSAQLTNMIEVEATAIKQMRAELVAQEKNLGTRVTFNDIYVKALSKALVDVPVLNSSLIDGEIILWEDINIGVAVAMQGGDELGGGLVVPVIYNVDRKSLSEISKELKEKIKKARENKLMPDEMTGSTFTITNMGAVPGVEFKYSTPIINQPESAILSTGLIMDKPVARDGEIVVRPMMPLSLTFDHRVIDGAPSTEFLGRLAIYLTNPFLLLS